MSDEHPTPYSQGAAPGARRAWLWPVGIVIVIALAVAAWFAAEAVARGIVTNTIREQAITQLALPADQQIDVDLPGPLLLPLLIGQIPHLSISTEDVPLEGLVADITVTADDVNLNGGDWSGGHANVRIDETQLRDLLARVDGFPAATVALDAPNVAATFDLEILSARVPVGVALTPRAVAGDIVLTPAAVSLGGVELGAEALERQFGALASTVLRDWDVCIADRLPSALTLTAIEVERSEVVADFEIDSAIVAPGAAAQKGTCA